jgi:hypothetical protein
LGALAALALSLTLSSGCTRHPTGQSKGGLFVIDAEFVESNSKYFPINRPNYRLSLRRVGLDGVELPTTPLRKSMFGAPNVPEYTTRVRSPGGVPLQPFCHDQKPAARCGHALLKPNGGVELLGGACPAPQPIALHSGDVLLATTACDTSSSPTRVLLVRRDGKTFDRSGTAMCEVRLPGEIRVVIRQSLAFGGQSLYFIGDCNDGRHRVYRAPLDCSAPAVALGLPDVAGKPPTVLQPHLGPSEDGRWLAIVGGPSADERDVLVLDTRDGSLINLTDAPAPYAAPQTDPTGGGVEVSPDGTHVAFFVEKLPFTSEWANNEFNLRRVDKKAPVKVLPFPWLNVGQRVRWLDANALITVAWVEPGAMDLPFPPHHVLAHYQLLSEKLEYLYQLRGRALPAWTSPNGAQLLYRPDASPDRIVALERASGKVTTVWGDVRRIVSGLPFAVGREKGRGESLSRQTRRNPSCPEEHKPLSPRPTHISTDWSGPIRVGGRTRSRR